MDNMAARIISGSVITNVRQEDGCWYADLEVDRENTFFFDHALDHVSGTLLIVGLGSSGGRVRGRAKVISDPTLHVALGPDAILVARETDPGWLFLMLSVRGLIVERGSMLSHTAITGRKLGIPTVVAVPHATTRIPDNSLIEIDGTSGEVRVLSEHWTKQMHQLSLSFPLLGRWLMFVTARFSVPRYLTYSILWYTALKATVVATSTSERVWIVSFSDGVSAFTVFLIFLFLRMVDDWKDMD